MKTVLDELILPQGTPMEALRQAVGQEIRSAVPGIVKAFDAASQTATILPAVQEKDADGEWVTLPLLLDVPVFFPGGSGTAITFPVRTGDDCLVVFSDTCIDGWFQSGAPQQPISFRRHDLSDGFALVGFRSRPHFLPASSFSAEDTFAVHMRKANGTWIKPLSIDVNGVVDIEQFDNIQEMTEAQIDAIMAS